MSKTKWCQCVVEAEGVYLRCSKPNGHQGDHAANKVFAEESSQPFDLREIRVRWTYAKTRDGRLTSDE